MTWGRRNSRAWSFFFIIIIIITITYLLNLLTAIGLSRGSSRTLVQTNINIHKTTKQLQSIKITKNNKKLQNNKN
jgi:hypothetical protein